MLVVTQLKEPWTNINAGNKLNTVGVNSRYHYYMTIENNSQRKIERSQ